MVWLLADSVLCWDWIRRVRVIEEAFGVRWVGHIEGGGLRTLNRYCDSFWHPRDLARN
jgi:hypothetical protein